MGHISFILYKSLLTICEDWIFSSSYSYRHSTNSAMLPYCLEKICINLRCLAQEIYLGQNAIHLPVPLVFNSLVRRYISFSLIVGSVKNERFNFIMDKMQRRLSRWKWRLLNKVGWLTLASLVLQAIIVYM